MLEDQVSTNKNPGPGTNDMRSSFGESPGYGFGTSRRKDLKDDGQPGPGSYDFIPEVGDI